MKGDFVKRGREECILCGAENIKEIYSVAYTDPVMTNFLETYYRSSIPREVLDSNNYSLYRCDECSLIYQSTVLNDENLLLLYDEWISSEDSLKKHQCLDINSYSRISYNVENIYKYVKKQPHDIKVIEVGVGWCNYLRMANAYGFDTTGIELSTHRIKHCKKSGLNIIDSLDGLSDQTYDYCYSNQVFEHITAPLELLKELARVMKAGGIIQIVVPNGNWVHGKVKSRKFKISKGPVQPLEHINCFTRKALNKMAKQCGLEPISPIYDVGSMKMNSFIFDNIKFLYDLTLSTNIFLKKT